MYFSSTFTFHLLFCSTTYKPCPFKSIYRLHSSYPKYLWSKSSPPKSSIWSPASHPNSVSMIQTISFLCSFRRKYLWLCGLVYSLPLNIYEVWVVLFVWVAVWKGCSRRKWFIVTPGRPSSCVFPPVTKLPIWEPCTTPAPPCTLPFVFSFHHRTHPAASKIMLRVPSISPATPIAHSSIPQNPLL